MQDKNIDICLFLEGTYPYVPGGVSGWTHELIAEQNHLNFHIVALVAPGAELEMRYELPENVVGITNVFLQQLPDNKVFIPAKKLRKLFTKLEAPLLDIQKNRVTLESLKQVIDALGEYKHQLNADILLNSEHAWQMLLSMYEKSMPDTAFIDYFWSWRALLGGLYAVLLADLPEAKAYHALCTGYAGLFLARAHMETGRPCIVTEHGIYTNERRIEIASADWLLDQKAYNLSISQVDNAKRELRDFWIDEFAAYSRLCYEASEQIVTLYRGNQTFQSMDGADMAKMRVIPNGIDYEKFSSVKRENDHPPTVALIGRVVPIKDIKTFIRAMWRLCEDIPDLRAFIMGGTDEDEEYYHECVAMVKNYNLESVVTFTGKVNLLEYLGQVDALVLSSISEAQPLVILEAGAAGIPCVATDVGSCRELIMGRDDEHPPVGAGGGITPLSNARAIAGELLPLLTDAEHHAKCSENTRRRVKQYYNKTDQHSAYRDLYNSLVDREEELILHNVV